MKKALQGFWRGGLLGGLLGLLGCEVSVVIWMTSEYFYKYVIAYHTVEYYTRMFYATQIEFVFPSLVFGIVIGALFGIAFIFKLHHIETWKRIGITVAAAAALSFTIGSRWWVRYLGPENLWFYERFVATVVDVRVIYLIAAALYGYIFNGEKPDWTKFWFGLRLKRKRGWGR